MVTQIYKIRSEIWVAPSSEIWRPNNVKFRRDFAQLRLDREYLRNATRHRQSENGIANCGHPRTGNLIRYTSVHKRRKIGPEFWPTQRAAIIIVIAKHLLTRRRSWECISPPSKFLKTPRFGKICGFHVRTVPGNTCVKFEVRRFNRFGAVSN